MLAVAPAGCGSSSSGRSAPKETTDPPPAALPGWTRLINDTAGFSLSLPPGWTTRRSGEGSTLIRSTDRALALAVSADRGNDGADDPPAQYLERTVRHLSGYRNLRFGRGVGMPGLRYPAARLTATGTFARTHVRQAITLYALHRPGVVTYTVAVLRSAAISSGRYAPYLQVVLRSFRGRPARV
ncbi:MAG: hypothetical protein QOJ55_1061 [Solirubrobacteraceae bacterium]|nr:hypothetical protein [Solirubrobacteraceae bacterium]